MEYIQIIFEHISEETKDILIALLTNVKFDGFEEENQTLKAYIPLSNFNQTAFDNIIQKNSVSYLKSIIKEENWNSKWEADFQPVEIFSTELSKPFVYIRANFHPPKPLFKFDLCITPKMSFGTGHHATTALMVSAMESLDFNQKTVIDFGTGTGILAILAEKLGSNKILAIDCDEWSIKNSAENIAENNSRYITLLKADQIKSDWSADIILANINLNIIADNLPAIKSFLKKEGIILFSGVMLRDEEKIILAIKQQGLKIESITKSNDWLCIKATNL
jgi:ribosomal protein L11 methyltransferase